MSEHERLVVFEDDPQLKKIMLRSLKVLGHEVVAQAETMEEARDLIPKIGELQISAAIIDGSLGEYSRGKHGEEINKKIKELFPKVFTIGWSGDFIEGVDVHFGKGSMRDIFNTLKEIKPS
jgi:hypothetical protein